MRQERTVQATIFEVFARHEIGCALQAISQWLDEQRRLVSLAAGDLRRQGVRETGRRGLPTETVLRCTLLNRQIARRGAPPRQTAADGGYASRDNLKQAKARGVQDVAFHKKCGIAVADMVSSPWVYRRLRNFRAGIEAGISVFKRAYGGARCIWRGLDHFKAYIWSAVVAHNLMLFARLKSP